MNTERHLGELIDSGDPSAGKELLIVRLAKFVDGRKFGPKDAQEWAQDFKKADFLPEEVDRLSEMYKNSPAMQEAIGQIAEELRSEA